MYQSLSKLCAVGVLVFFVSVPLYAEALVNINTADATELMTLNGIGEVKAQSIIDYRTNIGLFQVIEDIMNVSGIGTVTFANIKDFITVGTTQAPPETPPETQTEIQSETPPTTATGGGGFIPDTKKIYVDIGAERTVFVGADSVFSALVIGATGDSIDNARVVWSFGDGGRKEGNKVLHNFAYPGTYVVVADASNGVYSASGRVTVHATPALISIAAVTHEYIALSNDGEVEIDVGGWLLFSAGKQFAFPEHTIIPAQQEVYVSNARTGLSGADPGAVALQYPNGLVATHYEYPLFISYTSPNKPAASSVSVPQEVATLDVPGDEPFAATAQITAPIVAVEEAGVWPWLVGICAIAGAGAAAVVFVRRREYGYQVEEISS